MTDVAVLGTGRMGSAIAARLIATGHDVTVWNRDPAKANAIAGATSRPTPAEAAAGAGLVITMLTDGAAVRQTLAAARLGSGTTVVQMSTISPRETHELRQIPEIREENEIVDAPVAGSVDAARAGTLTIFVSGPDAAVAKAEPILTDLGTIKRVADGSAVKLVVNTAMVTALAALHDTLAVARAFGVDEDVLTEGPLGAALKRAASTTADFPVALAAKDLRLTGAESPVIAAARKLLEAVPDQSADVSAMTRTGPTE